MANVFSWNKQIQQPTDPIENTGAFSWQEGGPPRSQTDIRRAQAQVEADERTFGESFFGGLKSGFLSYPRAPVEENFHITERGILTDPAIKGYQTFRQVLEESHIRAFEQGEKFRAEDATTLEKGTAVASTGLAYINAVLSPIIATMEGATELPLGVGSLAEEVNAIFAAIGEGSAQVGTKVLYESSLSPETKEELEPVVAEASGLVGQIVAGKGGHSAFKRFDNQAGKILETVDKDIGTRQLPVTTETPGVTNLPLRRSGFLPEELPVIDAGAGRVPSTGLPTIQIGTPKPRTSQTPGDFVYEPVIDRTPFSFERRPQRSIPEGIQEPGKFQSRTSLRLREEALVRGLKGVDDVPIQDRRSRISSIETADRFVERDAGLAERALLEKDLVPRGIEVGDIYKALEVKALAEGDVAMINRLSQINLGTEAARGLKAFDRPIDGSIDLVRELKSVREARIADAVTKDKSINVEKAVKQARKEAGDIRPPGKDAWSEFIREISC